MPLLTPCFLVDNLFDGVVQYPSHTIVAEEEPSGFEAYRFAAGRRDQYASATTANSDWWIKAIFDRTRAFDCCALWVHNLAGEGLRIQCSDDDFATTQTIFDATLPTTPGAGDVDDALGVLCENGMWLKRFPVRMASAVRLYSVAMGAGLKPQVAGMLGLSFSLGQYDKPFAPSDTELVVREETNESGWTGRGPRRLRRHGSIIVKTRSAFEYDQLRYHLEGRYAAGAPMLIVHDDSQAERAVMAQRPAQGRFGFHGVADWPDELRTGEFAWQEMDPAEVGAT